MSASSVQVFSIYIAASAATVWAAITTSEYTNQWGYGGDVSYDLRPGGEYTNLSTAGMREMGMGAVAVSGTVVEVEPNVRLVLDWKPSWHPELAATRVTWELTEYSSGLTRVVLTHDTAAAPELAAEIAGGGDPGQGGGGWGWGLSGLKTLLETGKPMDAA
ncbi:MAG: SRPBCC domain-containing protein [Propioniciclava sp.]